MLLFQELIKIIPYQSAWVSNTIAMPDVISVLSIATCELCLCLSDHVHYTV